MYRLWLNPFDGLPRLQELDVLATAVSRGNTIQSLHYVTRCLWSSGNKTNKEKSLPDIAWIHPHLALITQPSRTHCLKRLNSKFSTPRSLAWACWVHSFLVPADVTGQTGCSTQGGLRRRALRAKGLQAACRQCMRLKVQTGRLHL